MTTNNISNNKLHYIFIDEIQLLEDWQRVANALRLKENVDLYLTGSNAYMFSSDLANFFGGRYMEIKMQPYSFVEFCNPYFNRKSLVKKSRENFLDPYNFSKAYDAYITESGFPQVTDFWGDKELIGDYLSNVVYLNTIQKDIVQRFELSDSIKMENVIKYIFDNIGSETSIRNIEKQLKGHADSASISSIQKYLKGLIDSYLVYKCEPFDVKGKQILEGNCKYYVADVGLRGAVLGRSPERDRGHILENVVYLELVRRGYRVYIGKVATKSIKNEQGKYERKSIELDFIATKPDGQLEYYQVAYSVADENTLERELAPFKEIQDNYPKILLSMDYGSGEIDGIKRLNVLEWLLGSC